MYKTEGYWNVTARIKQLSFPRRGKFQVDLQDGRSIVMPVSAPVVQQANMYAAFA